MAKKNKKSALYEVAGVEQHQRLNTGMLKNISKKKELPDADTFVSQILSGDKIVLSKAITLIESNNPSHFHLGQEIVKKCLPYAGKSIRLGITGVPGVGKSTFIESLGKRFTNAGHKLAVLAVDPSSSISKGSILGDKTRMEELARDANAYIRPSPSGNNLGGVARKTRETIVLCEAAGYDRILIETVGVGQSETIVYSMVDFLLLLKLAGAGDELQGIKRGIIEMADLLVVNKAEGDNINAARLAQKAFENALHFYPPKENGWYPKVLLASALYDKGLAEVEAEVEAYIQLTKSNGFFDRKRKQQNIYWLYESINRRLQDAFYKHPQVAAHLPEWVQRIEQNKITAFEAASALLELYAHPNEKE